MPTCKICQEEEGFDTPADIQFAGVWLCGDHHKRLILDRDMGGYVFYTAQKHLRAEKEIGPG